MKYLLFIPVALIIICSCGTSKKALNDVSGVSEGTDLKIASYNIENLFDLTDDPVKKDEDFTPTGSMKWTQERYNKKLGDIAYVIKQLGGNGSSPDIIGLIEVENGAVLADLVRQQAIKSRGYKYVHYESPDERGIDVALLYDEKVFQPFARKTIRINLPGKDSTTRDILMVTGKIRGRDTLTVMVNHWPSRRNPEEMRLITARKARSVVDSIFDKNADANIVLVGDFNDEPDNESLKILTEGKTESRTLVNAMTELKKQGLGTHEYKKEWNMLDQIVYSASLKTGKWKYVEGSAGIVKEEFLLQQDERFKGSPYRTYAGERYLGGYSDHLPVRIRFSYTK